MSTPARLPAINVPQGLEPGLRDVLSAMKERLEVREGSRGQPLERAATMRDLEALTKQTAGRTVTDIAEPVASDNLARLEVGQIIGSEVARLRTEIQNSERGLTSMLDGMFGGTAPGAGLSAIESMALGAVNRYTQARLADDLASGAATIIAGATSGDAVMELAPDGSYVLFKHRLANLAGLGAGYAGTVRTAVGITAAGFIAGYNKLADGAWQNSVVIDSSTGNVTILGTLKAASVIEVGVTVGVGGTSMGTIESQAASVSTKLTAQAVYILGGDFSLKTSGYDAGSGLILTNTGILGRKAYATTFAIDNTGTATFSGDITGGANLDITGGARISGSKTSATFLGYGAAIVANDSLGATHGIIALTSNASAVGASVGYSYSAGVPGGYFGSSTGGSGGKALVLNGTMEINTSTLVTNLNAQLWNGTTLSGPSSGAATATFVNTNKPGGASSNNWLVFTNAGNTYYVPAWT